MHDHHSVGLKKLLLQDLEAERAWQMKSSPLPPGAVGKGLIFWTFDIGNKSRTYLEVGKVKSFRRAF